MQNKWVRTRKGLRTVPGPRKPFIIAIFQYYSATLPFPSYWHMPAEDTGPLKTMFSKKPSLVLADIMSCVFLPASKVFCCWLQSPIQASCSLAVCHESLTICPKFWSEGRVLRGYSWRCMLFPGLCHTQQRASSQRAAYLCFIFASPIALSTALQAEQMLGKCLLN